MTDETLDDEIKTLAVQIETQIKNQKQELENSPEFDSSYRRMKEAEPIDTDELFA